jgi:uncharacterized membrane protein YtjA (UPF0391 family)
VCPRAAEAAADIEGRSPTNVPVIGPPEGLTTGLFGFTGISATAAGIAKVLFFIFIVAFLVFLIIGIVVGPALF